MIPADKASKFIESKKARPITKGMLKGLSTSYQKLGAYLTLLETDNNFGYSYFNVEDVYKKFTHYFGDDPMINPWKSKEGQKLALIMYGNTLGAYISDVWQLINVMSYQTGWHRHAFRSKPSADYTKQKLQVCYALFHSSENGARNMTIPEMARYNVYTHADLSVFFGAVLNNEGENGPMFDVLNDIINGEDEIGGVTRSIIVGLLLTERKECWRLVEGLLLAAQRQEGLRQTILESVDSSTPRALHHMIGVILEHDLCRFSSVVRAVDTWFGFAWDTPKKNTVKRILEMAYEMMHTPERITAGLDSKDNLEVYTALWSLGVEDIDKAIAASKSVYQNGDVEKKILCCFFYQKATKTAVMLEQEINEYFGDNLALDYWTLMVRPKKMVINDDLFHRIQARAEDMPKDGKGFDGKVFSWLSFKVTPDYFYEIMINNASAEVLERLANDISQISNSQRYQLVSKIFPGFVYYNHENKNKVLPDYKKRPWLENALHQSLTDRNSQVVGIALAVLKVKKLNEKDLNIIEDLFARKAKSTREFLINTIVGQKEKIATEMISNLLESKKVDQRLAGLEMMSVLRDKNKYADFIDQNMEAYKTRSKLSKNEKVYLDRLIGHEEEYTIENGFGAVDYNKMRPIYQPRVRFEEKTQKGILNKVKNVIGAKGRPNVKDYFGELYDKDKMQTTLDQLITIYETLKEKEFSHTAHDGSTSKHMMTNGEIFTDNKSNSVTLDERYKYLAFYEEWAGWYERAQLSDFEVLMLMHNLSYYTNVYTQYGAIQDLMKRYVVELKNNRLDITGGWNSINQRLSQILRVLFYRNADIPMMATFQLDIFEDLLVKIPETFLDENNRYYNEGKLIKYRLLTNYFPMEHISGLSASLNHPDIPPKLKLRYWDLIQYCSVMVNSYHKKENTLANWQVKMLKLRDVPSPSHTNTLELYSHKMLNEEDLKFQYLANQDVMRFFERAKSRKPNYFDLSSDKLEKVNTLKYNLITTEMQRGDLVTDASKYMNTVAIVKGIDYLIELLQRLGKENFNRGYYYHNSTKKSSFSSLIKKCHPKEEESLSDFIQAAQNSKILKRRWIEVAMYAPQWALWVEEYTKVKGLLSGVWWFHAHTNDYRDAERETMVSRYSNIEGPAFSDGAFDVDWFHEAYALIGKSNWKLLHDASKYITDGNGHRRVKLYSSVMLGEVKITETLKKIKDKRDKDYVRALGLIPLSKTIFEKDLIKRYNLLQQFLKESKQFGSQRQTSEKTAVNICLENLARTAGYSDVTRFTWAMEGKAAQEIMAGAHIELDENISIELVVDEAGKADIIVEKSGKTQKSIPAKYKKDKRVIALKEKKTYLRNQYKRTRVSLENAMCLQESFSKEELANIMKHPVVRALLSKLILQVKDSDKFGLWNDGSLINHEGRVHKINNDEKVIIAHSYHMYSSVVWDVYQKYAFDQKMVQPFKQIFRELYIVTPDEKEAVTKSKRYAGHQIQPVKAAALLKTRGWTAQYGEGLQKVMHRHGIVATMYAKADWFTPAEVEAPTIEYVQFHHRDTYRSISLSEIDGVVFSETMRDVDLVVSVAHVGGVDPEASHSSMEMRAALAKESARLFKLDNVEVLERYILVKGKLGEYNIHLGSGVVSRNGLQLSIIAVQSQHRGRMFLPFLDADPRSAEIISKMKMLASDDKIKDPTILAQIMG